MRDDIALVSRATCGAAANGTSFVPTISVDGRVVAFESAADNLSAEDVHTVENVFARDLPTGTTTLVSRASGPGGAGGDSGSADAAISRDARFVAFDSAADNLLTEDDDDYATSSSATCSRARRRWSAGPRGREGRPATPDPQPLHLRRWTVS